MVGWHGKRTLREPSLLKLIRGRSGVMHVQGPFPDSRLRRIYDIAEPWDEGV